MSQFLHPRDAASRSRSKSRPRRRRSVSSTSSQGSFTEAMTGRVRDGFNSVRDRFSRSRSRDGGRHNEGRAPLPNNTPGLATRTQEMQNWRDDYVDWVPARDADLRRKEQKRRDREAREQRRRDETDREERFRAMGVPLKHHRPSHRSAYEDNGYDAAAPKRSRGRCADQSAERTDARPYGNPYPPGYYHDSRYAWRNEEPELRISRTPFPTPRSPPKPIERLPNPALWDRNRQDWYH